MRGITLGLPSKALNGIVQVKACKTGDVAQEKKHDKGWYTASVGWNEVNTIINKTLACMGGLQQSNFV